MKARNWIFWVVLGGIVFCIVLQFYAVPIIQHAQARYSKNDRTAFCLVREELAREYNR